MRPGSRYYNCILGIVCRTSGRMRLSTVFELLLIFLLVAFAAYGRVIGRQTLDERQKFPRLFLSLFLSLSLSRENKIIHARISGRSR